MQIVFILSGSFIARRYKGVRIWVMIGYLAPSLLGLILQLAVPRTAKAALLFGNYLVSLRLPPPSPPHPKPSTPNPDADPPPHERSLDPT